MHMLHTRRKAEIEIISTAKSFRPLFEFPSMTGMDGQALHTASRSPPLLVYMLDKISNFVDAYVDV
jgi:hypothetical protein